MMIAYAHGARDCPGYIQVSLRDPTAMLEDIMMTSVKKLYIRKHLDITETGCRKG